jgi:transcriptional regulator with XRE-family HTH domain
VRVTVSAFRLIRTGPLVAYSGQMTPLESSGASFTGHRGAPSRAHDNVPEYRASTKNATYCHAMPPSTPARKLAFAAFVRKALDDARATRAWTGTEVSRRTGISRQTLNRWVRGDWASDPEAERVVAFCDGLGINPSVAFGVLGWDRAIPARPAPAAPPMDPDVEALLRRLVDPNVSAAEKFHIRETIRYLAYRPALPAEPRKGRKRAS